MNKGIYSRMVDELTAEQQLLHTQQVLGDLNIGEDRTNMDEKIEDEVVVDEIKNEVEVSSEANISSYTISINKRRERMNKRANEAEVDASASEAVVDASASEAVVANEVDANEVEIANEVASEAVPEEVDTKKRNYRGYIFDRHDTDYANTLKGCFTSNDEATQQHFNEVTGNLMTDKQISRHGLLDAIDDYKRSGYNVDYPLSSVFTDNAFNYRPWQGCVIS